MREISYGQFTNVEVVTSPNYEKYHVYSFFFVCFLSFCLLSAALVAYGSSQARG